MGLTEPQTSAPPEPSPPHPEHARPSPRDVFITLAVLLLLLHLLSRILTPIILSAALAYAVQPVVRMLQVKLGWPRWVAVSCVFVATLGLVGGGGYWIGSTLIQAVGQIGGQLPELLRHLLQDLLGDRITILGTTYETNRLSQSIVTQIAEILNRPGWLLVGAETIVGLPATLVLSAVTLFYFISAGPRLGSGLLRLVPPRYRAHLADQARQVDPLLRNYIRGVAVVVAYTSIVAYLTLHFVFHLRFAGMIAVVVGTLELIPVIGPAAAMVLISATALLSGHGLYALGWSLGFAVLLRVSIDEGLGPVVLGRFVALHPVAIIIAFLVAGSLFGVVGVLLAVPACAAGKLLLKIHYGEATRR